MVMSQVLYAALRARGADRIEVIAPPATAPLPARMPEVDAVHELPAGHGQLALAARWRLGRALRGRHDTAIVLPGSWKSALVPLIARVPRRRGWLGEQRYGLLNQTRRLQPAVWPRMIDRFAALAEAGFPPPDGLSSNMVMPRLSVDTARRDRLMDDLRLDRQLPPVVLCPGAEFGAAKRWPPDRYAQLARRLIDGGAPVWLMGGPGDVAIAAAIEAAAPGVINLAGRTTLCDAVDLMSLAAAVVTNDSGLMHVAAALDRPLVAVYGSSSPDFTPPLSPRARIVSRALDCQPCFARECPLGHQRCLRELSSERVQAELEPLLAAL